jgi:hypothetical protein
LIYTKPFKPQTENDCTQSCSKQSEENDVLEQQLNDAQYTLTGDQLRHQEN